MKVIDSSANYLIDILMLTKEFQYYLDNQDELVKKYNHIGDYNTYEEALFETSKEHELGTFLIQECTEGDSAYTQTFHSRVIFV